MHSSNSAVPAIQSAFPLFETLAEQGHKILNSAEKGCAHDGYGASAYTFSSSDGGIGAYIQGINNILDIGKLKKKINHHKIPT